MIELLMLLSLSPVATQTTVAAIQPCVWPNTCAQEQVLAAKPYQACVWPNKCAKPTFQVAQGFEICSWPHKCAKPTLQVAQFRPCVWPNTCKAEGVI
ncbi:MAG: hypothetical protein WC969_12555 [Elusimicrobiota bacterium]|jgi:hypothetical protein